MLESDEAGEHVHGLQVAAESVATRAGDIDQTCRGQGLHGATPRERQSSPIGHEVADAGVRTRRLDACGRGRELGMEPTRHDRGPIDAGGLDQGPVMLALGRLRSHDLRLPWRVPDLHDVPGTGVDRARPVQVPQDERNASGAETELDSRRVEDHRVADLDGPEHVRESLGIQLGTVLQPSAPSDDRAARLGYLRDARLSESSHLFSGAYSDAISFATRSSLALNGSLQSTVRCA